MERINPKDDYPARWWHAIEEGRIQCDLCPHNCKLREGQRGACYVRAMLNGKMVLTTYGRSSGFCIDPIEKKPLYNFFPGSSVFSFGTAGCNLACKFCQNWDISKSREMDTLMDAATPAAIAAAAASHGSRSVAFTYNDPVIFAEYAMETADACHALGIQTVAVSANTAITPLPAASSISTSPSERGGFRSGWRLERSLRKLIRSDRLLAAVDRLNSYKYHRNSGCKPGSSDKKYEQFHSPSHDSVINPFSQVDNCPALGVPFVTLLNISDI